VVISYMTPSLMHLMCLICFQSDLEDDRICMHQAAVTNSDRVLPTKAINHTNKGESDQDQLKIHFIGLWTPAGSRAYSRTKASLLPKELEFRYQRELSRFKLGKIQAVTMVLNR
jgi:hypothetical protein